MPVATLRLRTPVPFDLRTCLFGHGWIALAPHRFDDTTNTFSTVLSLDGAVVDATLRQAAGGELLARLTGDRPLDAAQKRLARRQIAHMIRLDDDLGPFHALCRREPRLRWAARRGAGRLLRSATVFEDLMKLLFTTNTTWSGTEAMTRNLVAAAGPVAPSGARGFPSPAACVRDAAFYRDVVRTGYRADAAVALASAFAEGRLDDDHFLRAPSKDELWRRLVSLRGFGPYAAGQAMRLCGHYEHLALDSWCRARLAAMARRRTPPDDRTVERRYAKFAPFQGLALWLDLTADWHGPDRDQTATS